jgi:murein DD-endopeptidase MepM/ murein hydrolase activator NlpD
VQYNDSLSQIARRYGVDLNSILSANEINNPNLLSVGEELFIPAPDLSMQPSTFKIIPDSEVVFGPASINFDLTGFLSHFDGRLAQMQHVDEVILRVAQDYSVNPRLLVLLLEYQTGWLSGERLDLEAPLPTEEVDGSKDRLDAWENGLFSVVSIIANRVNMGFYLWRAEALGYFVLQDGVYVPASATINAGTAGVQYWAAAVFEKEDWNWAVSEDGVFALYNQYFGYPFDFEVEPLLPPGLTQPDFVLPFEPGVPWSFTGGPHSAWGDGSAWAALDFAPTGNIGCAAAAEVVTAIADGVIIRAGDGAMIQDLDGDGFEQTGWVILYMHISSWDRVKAGTYVHAGEKIGHPSCEGGISSGTHLHLARRYNGEWISADASIPFRLSGYTASSAGALYDGYLELNGNYIEAWDRYRPESVVIR